MHKENDIATVVVDAAFKIHTALGPGLLESVYEAALAYELTHRGHTVHRQAPIRVRYEGHDLGEGFRADLIVDNALILELKSVEKTIPLYGKQLLTYLRLTGMRLGLLINFGESRIKDGIQRVVNGLPENPAYRR